MTPLHGYRVTAESGAPGEEPLGMPRYGCCLHLGPRGQRCERPAREDGFCTRHSPELAAGPWPWFRRFAAILVAAAILWPIIQAFLDELSHWWR